MPRVIKVGAPWVSWTETSAAMPKGAFTLVTAPVYVPVTLAMATATKDPLCAMLQETPLVPGVNVNEYVPVHVDGVAERGELPVRESIRTPFGGVPIAWVVAWNVPSFAMVPLMGNASALTVLVSMPAPPHWVEMAV